MDYPKELRELRKLFPAIKKFQTTPSPLTKRILSLKKDLRSITIFQQNPSIGSLHCFGHIEFQKIILCRLILIEKVEENTPKNTPRQDIQATKWTKTFRPTTSNPPFWVGTSAWVSKLRHSTSASGGAFIPAQASAKRSSRFPKKRVEFLHTKKGGGVEGETNLVILMNLSGLRCSKTKIWVCNWCWENQFTIHHLKGVEESAGLFWFKSGAVSKPKRACSFWQKSG